MKSYKKVIIGVIGASKISKKTEKLCEQLGAAVAKEGWVTLTGGEPNGVMDFALKGAAEAGGETVGILPGNRKDPYSQFITVPIFTNVDLARDYFNVLTSDVLVIVGAISAGTLIEVAFALKKNVPIILLDVPKTDVAMLQNQTKKKVQNHKYCDDVIIAIKKYI